jgi:hypothetical protein
MTFKFRIVGVERGSTRSLSVENLIWKLLWTCSKTYYRTIMVFMLMMNEAFVVRVICSRWRKSVIQTEVR